MTLLPCKPFEGYVNDDGYGYRRHEGVPTPAHRVAYIEAHGSIPEGHQIDHLCHDPNVCPGGKTCPHRRCVEITHLEAVPQKENLRRGGGFAGKNFRKTHCDKGHEFTPENTITRPKGRECRTCHNTDQRRYAAARRERA